MNEIRNVLSEEILSEMTSIGNMTLGSDEHVKTVKAICDMTDKLTELNNKQAELEIKKIQSENDKKFKEKEYKLKEELADSEKKHFWITCCITVGTSICTWIANDRFKKWFINKEYDFEGVKNKIHSSNIGRNGTNKIIGQIFHK